MGTVMDLVSRVSPSAVAPDAATADINDLLNTSANTTVDGTHLCEFIVEMARSLGGRGVSGSSDSSSTSSKSNSNSSSSGSAGQAQQCTMNQLCDLLGHDLQGTGTYSALLQMKVQSWLRLPSLGPALNENVLDAFSSLSLQATGRAGRAGRF